jgi:hypothetical protein
MELITFLLALAALILALRNSSAVGQFENRQRGLRLEFERILVRIDKLAAELKALRDTPKAEPSQWQFHFNWTKNGSPSAGHSSPQPSPGYGAEFRTRVS